jgi:hypothetical protein
LRTTGQRLHRGLSRQHDDFAFTRWAMPRMLGQPKAN